MTTKLYAPSVKATKDVAEFWRNTSTFDGWTYC